MNRLLRTMLLAPLLLPLGAAAGGHDLVSQDPDMVETESLIEGTLLELGQIDKRLTVPVAVGARGPYNFIIDTGAERTVVSRELAGALGLTQGQPVMLTSMTGTSAVDTVVVPDLSIKSIGLLHTVIAPALNARNLGAVGLLGIDTLSKHKVTIDFEAGTMMVRPSLKRDRNRVTRRDEIVVTAKNVFGQLIVTDAYYKDTRIQVVLDTGSQVTMGNSALRRRVGARIKEVRPIQLTSVTGDQTTADYVNIPDVRVGRLAFGSMPVAFRDVAPFKRFNLVKRPALLLGMDALSIFARVDIDFPNRQVRFTMPKNARYGTTTGSMIPGAGGASPTRSY